MDTLKRIGVSEAFYSIQGEGKTMGRPSVFIRLSGCNLMCGGAGTEKDGKLHNEATWRCDSIEVWRKGKMFTALDLTDKLDKEFSFLNRLKKGAHLIITGGEPMMQQPAIIDFVNWLHDVYLINPFVEIETNGTLPMSTDFKEFAIKTNKQFNVSPKLANSGELLIRRQLHIDYLQVNSQFKFVVASELDIAEVSNIIKQYRIPTHQVWLMPAASTQDELNAVSDFVAKSAMNMGCNYSHRLHISIWNQKTGV